MQKKTKKRIGRLSFKLFALFFLFSIGLLFLSIDSGFRIFRAAAIYQSLGFEQGISSYIAGLMEEKYPDYMKSDEILDSDEYSDLQEDIIAITRSVKMKQVGVVKYVMNGDAIEAYYIAGAGDMIDGAEFLELLDMDEVDYGVAQDILQYGEPLQYQETSKKQENDQWLSVVSPIKIDEKVCGIAYVSSPVERDALISEDVKESITFALIEMLAWIIGLVIVLIVISSLMIVRPVVTMTRQVMNYSVDYSDEAFKKDIKTHDELQTLYETFRTLSDNIKRHTIEQAEKAAEEERRATEYRMATEMRESILPEQFNKQEDLFLDIGGKIIKSGTPSGDFYDWFEGTDGRIFFITASIDETSMVAATYLTITHAILRSYLMSENNLKESMSKINEQIFRNVGRDHPVRLFLGVIDTNEGILYYVNCGSTPPFIIRKGARAEALSGRVYESLGLSENISYMPEKIELHYNDRIYLLDKYLDKGIVGSDGETYTTGNILRILEQFESRNESASENLLRIESDITNFLGGNEIAHDVLLVALKFTRPNKEQAEIILPPVMNNYSQLQNFLKLQMKQNHVEGKDYAKILVVSEELFSLLCRYSRGGRIRTVCKCNEEEKEFNFEMVVTFKGGDEAVEFTSQENNAIEFIRNNMDSFELTTAENRITAVAVKKYSIISKDKKES